MNFKYSVITDNTKAARKWLEMLGYKRVNKLSCPCRKIITYPQGVYTLTPISITNRKDVIDCTNNPQLFQAVSAIRDGIDIMQYFTNGVHWYLCESVRFANSELMEIDRGGSDYWKATLSELQQHFK